MSIVHKRNRKGKFSGILKIMSERIENGVYSDRIPGINALAEEFGVNRKTVDRAILHMVAEGILVRSLGRGTFLAEHAPEEPIGCGGKNSRRYAFIVDENEGYTGYLALLDGCDEVISGINGSVLFTRFSAIKNHQKLLGRLRAQRIEGIFVCSTIGHKLLDLLKKEFNVVMVDAEPERDVANTVIWDNFGAGYNIGRRLIKKGCLYFSCLEFCGCPQEQPVVLSCNHKGRLAGLIAAVEEAKLSYSVHYCDWSLSQMYPGADLAEELRNNTSRRALVSSVYQLIYPALARLSEFPLLSELRIGSYVNSLHVNGLCPGVYAELDMRRMGRVAAETLLDVLGRPPGGVRHEILVPEMIETSNTRNCELHAQHEGKRSKEGVS